MDRLICWSLLAPPMQTTSFQPPGQTRKLLALVLQHLRGLNRRLKNLHNTQDQFIEKVIAEHEVNAQNDPNVPPDLVDVLHAASTDKDMEFQITRDNIKAVLFVC